MADRAALEMPCALTGTAGSNPALSVCGMRTRAERSDATRDSTPEAPRSESGPLRLWRPSDLPGTPHRLMWFGICLLWNAGDEKRPLQPNSIP